MDDLTSKVAVITGAASGIGLALAQRFAAEGMKLVVSDIESTALDLAAKSLIRSGAEVEAVVADVSIGDEVRHISDRALERFGAVHLLCNNAGVGSRGLKLVDVPARDLEWVLGVNLWGVMHGVWAFLPLMREQNIGHIVNTASISAFVPRPRMGPYNASKAAVVALSETLQFELDEEGSNIGVSVLCPSWVRTNISQAARNLPERLHYELTPSQAEEATEYKSRRRQVVQNGAIDADQVALMVRDAIVERQFYVFTHDECFNQMDSRFARVLATTDPFDPGIG